MAWVLTNISEAADCTLDAWSVFEVPFDGVGNPWTRHFVGFKREGCRGQVSSPVEQIDVVRRRGLTRSEKVYELAGRPGLNGDALATWGRWRTTRGITDVRDVTAEVEALLQPGAEASPQVAGGAAAVETLVQQALRSLKYWDASADISMDGHRRHDLCSLALHEAAVSRLKMQPELARQALDVLARWERGNVHSRPLFDEWRRIIESRGWQRAVERSDRGQQLRQASPLAFVLDKSERDAIRARFRRGGGK